MLSAKEAAPELLLARSWRHGPRASSPGATINGSHRSIGGVGWAFKVEYTDIAREPKSIPGGFRRLNLIPGSARLGLSNTRCGAHTPGGSKDNARKKPLPLPRKKSGFGPDSARRKRKTPRKKAVSGQENPAEKRARQKYSHQSLLQCSWSMQ